MRKKQAGPGKVTLGVLRNFVVQITPNLETEKTAVTENVYLDINSPSTT